MNAKGMPPVERIITVMGSASVGKSAITLRFTEDSFTDDYDPTIAKTHHCSIRNRAGIEYNLKLYDTAGMEAHSLIPSMYTANSHGYILVYSIADRQSFSTIKDIYDKLSDELNRINIPLVVVGNKSDLDYQRVITYSEGKELADSWHAAFLETSAKKGDKVKDVFLTLLNIIDPPVIPLPTTGITSTSSNNSGAGRRADSIPVGGNSRRTSTNETKCLIS